MNSLKLKNLHEKIYLFSNKILKTGFAANVKWKEEPGFGMLHHIYQRLFKGKGMFKFILVQIILETLVCD